MNYRNKDHLHKPKKGKGSYKRCRVNTTTVDGAMPQQGSSQQTETDSAILCQPAPKPSTSKDEKLSNTSTTTDQQTSGLNPTFRQ